FLIDLFSKWSRGLGAEPQVASAEAKLSRRVFVAKLFSLRPQCQRKKREWIRMCYIEKIHSVLFLGYVAARKSTKKNGEWKFRACGRDQGLRALGWAVAF
ncbi:MAG: hypothetical protein IJW70_00180, partial [Clostridia bacterium]|nr:hypothetical protein [Clostridia bacterium]